MPHPYFHVAPRYTAGSPAQVDEATARRVAAEEARNHQLTLAGTFGVAARDDAQLAGVDAVAYRTHEVGRYVMVTDLVTGNEYRVPVAQWVGRRWHERQDTAQYLV